MDNETIPRMNRLFKNIEFLGNGGKIISLPDNVDPFILT